MRSKEESETDYDLVLRQINLEVKKGELLIVIGSVGSGKTSLLLTLLGETYLLKEQNTEIGEVKIRKAVRRAYVEQEPFILSESVQDNITFGLPFHS